MSDETTLYQEIGVLQGQMSAIQLQQQHTTQQMLGLEKRLSTEIDKLVMTMNNRIVTVEGQQVKDRLTVAKIKWNVSAIAFGATTVASLAIQLIFHYIK